MTEIQQATTTTLIFYRESGLSTPFYLLSAYHRVTETTTNWEPTNLAAVGCGFVEFDFVEGTDATLADTGHYELRLYDQSASGNTDPTLANSELQRIDAKVIE